MAFSVLRLFYSIGSFIGRLTASKDLADWDLKNLIAYVVDEFGLPEAQPINGNPVPGGSRKPF